MTSEVRTKIRIEAPKLYDLPLRPNLSEKELSEAMMLRDFARGPMGVFGPPGSGKTTFDIWFALKLWRYFYRPVIADFWPSQEFIDKVEGNFTYVDEHQVLSQLKEIDTLAKRGASSVSAEEKSQWLVEGKAGTKFQGATFISDEAERWIDCRRGMSDINLLITDWFNRWRHLDISMVFSTPDPSTLDRRRATNRFIFWVECQPIMQEPTYEDYLNLCRVQKLEPDINEFAQWLTQQLQLFDANEMPALWYRYTMHHVRRVTATTVIDDRGSHSVDIFGPDIWKYFHTRNPTAGRAAMIQKYDKQQRQQERGN